VDGLYPSSSVLFHLGILVSFWIQYCTSHIDGQASWRIPIGIQMVATIILHITFYFMPESPRWLAQQDRQDEALKVLARVHSKGDTNNAYVKAELAEIVPKIEWEKKNPPMTYLTMLFGSEARRTWLAIGVVRIEHCTDLSEDSANTTMNSKSGSNLQVSTCRYQFYSNVDHRMLT
jgi:hypothetical protein